jgi:hypothetical protein
MPTKCLPITVDICTTSMLWVKQNQCPMDKTRRQCYSCMYQVGRPTMARGKETFHCSHPENTKEMYKHWLMEV